MGRIKKTTTKSTTSNVAVNNTVSYQGSVKVSLMKNKKIISSKIYKNTGKLPLFRFMVDCLAGDYDVANNNLPKFVQLFSLGKAGEAIPTTIEFTTPTIPRTPQKIIYQSHPLKTYTPEIKDNTGAITTSENATITFKFMVPYSQLTNDDNNDINCFALYSQTNYSSNTNPSAYIVLTDSTDKTKLGTITVEKNNHFVIYIEWTMTISNNS
jgi:hypothetical protein